MTDKASDDLQDNIPGGAEQEEEELDDEDYTPSFIKTVLDNKDLLPREFRENFLTVFEDFEYTDRGRAKTPLEFVLVSEATKLTLALQHLDHIENIIVLNQQRPAAESLFRKTHKGAAMRGAGAAIDIEATSSATKYFTDPAFKATADKAFEAAGYAPGALEGEAYLRVLPSLAMIHRQKTANRKALFSILKELEKRYASRPREKKIVVKKPGAKSCTSEDA
jgi:hypothetical protein